MIADNPSVTVLGNNVDAALLRLRGKINQSKVFVLLKRRKLNPSPGARKRAKVTFSDNRRRRRHKRKTIRKKAHDHRGEGGEIL